MENTTKSDPCIAEFMGRKFYAYRDNISYGQAFNTYEECLTAIFENKWRGYAPELDWKTKCGKYHESWDWLMPVFDKLTFRYDVAWKITSKGVSIHNHMQGFNGSWDISCPENVINDAYRAVVAYIKWHNQQPK